MGSNPTLSAITFLYISFRNFGEVQEWLNWQHWKCCERETVPWVRIPPSPPEENCGNAKLRECEIDYAPTIPQFRSFAISQLR